MDLVSHGGGAMECLRQIYEGEGEDIGKNVVFDGEQRGHCEVVEQSCGL